MNAPDTRDTPDASGASAFQRLRRFDHGRHSLPGEHWATFALGLYFLQHRPASALGRVASVVAGVALVARALSGRDGAVAMWRRVALRDSARERFVDVAAPWPYDERVRVAPAEPAERAESAARSTTAVGPAA
jgi:hypothetical protein